MKIFQRLSIILKKMWLWLTLICGIYSCIGDKSGEWFVRYGAQGRRITKGDANGSAALQPAVQEVQLDAFDPTLFIYDAYPGGIGFSDQLFMLHDQLLSAACHLILNCPCEAGCPSCVGPVLEVGVRAKETALAILDIIR